MVRQNPVTEVRDQIGNPEDKGFYNKRSQELAYIEDNVTLTEKQSRQHSWVVGSSTNGIVGPWTGTLDGEQLTVGPDPNGIIQTVTSPNNLFIERFNITLFNDTSVTTADWGVTAGQCDFTVGEIAQSKIIAKDGTTWTKATLTVDDATNLTLQLSADGGSNWETVTNATEHSFTNQGTDLKFKLTATGTASITYIKINYN